MIDIFLKMGNISQTIIPSHINFSAITAVYDIIKSGKAEEFPALNLQSCYVEDELNKVSTYVLSNKIGIIQLKYSFSGRHFWLGK